MYHSHLTSSVSNVVPLGLFNEALPTSCVIQHRMIVWLGRHLTYFIRHLRISLDRHDEKPAIRDLNVGRPEYEVVVSCLESSHSQLRVTGIDN